MVSSPYLRRTHSSRRTSPTAVEPPSRCKQHRSTRSSTCAKDTPTLRLGRPVAFELPRCRRLRCRFNTARSAPPLAFFYRSPIAYCFVRPSLLYVRSSTLCPECLRSLPRRAPFILFFSAAKLAVLLCCFETYLWERLPAHTEPALCRYSRTSCAPNDDSLLLANNTSFLASFLLFSHFSSPTNSRLTVGKGLRGGD